MTRMSSMQSAGHVLQRVKTQFETLPAWAGLLLAAATIAAMALITWQWQTTAGSTTAGDYLLEGQRFDRSQLRPIVQALAKCKLTAYVIDQRRRIRVPRGQAPHYHAALAAADALPGDFPSHMDEALQQSRIFESEYARQQRLRHARELDLALTIRTMEGIDDAMVQLDEIQERGFHTQRLVTASVSIRPDDGHVLDRGQIHAVGCLVAGANAGMQPDDVVITDLRSGISYVAGEANDAVGRVAEEYLRVKRAVERGWQQKLTQVLSFVPGTRVAVDVELRADADEPDRRPPSLTIPQRLAVSVAVPESYLLGVWRLRNAAEDRAAGAGPSAAQLQQLRDETASQIRDTILGLLPDRLEVASAVTVTTFSDLTHAPRNGGTRWRPWIPWSDSLKNHRFAWLAVVAGGLVVGGITWLSRRHMMVDPPQRSVPLPPLVRIPEDEFDDEKDDGTDEDDGTLRATLAELVRDDPDGAAEILHRWMDKAG
jgi:flagellar biosynthesis/type III secretory pathway M-ring protein FliF/YscJ